MYNTFELHLNKNDRNTETHYKDKSRKMIAQEMENMSLVDAWQNIKTVGEHYTWNNKKVKSRLDYYFTSKNSSYKLLKIYTSNVIGKQVGNKLTDHKALMIHMQISTSKRGPGYWKLNTSLLKNEHFRTELENTIKSAIENNKHLSHCKVWEIIKMRIKETSIKMAKEIRNKKKDRIKTLEKEIEHIKDEKVKMEKENELNLLYNEEAIGAQIRARVEMIDDSQFNTKLFKSLEKSKQMKNAINCLKDDRGKEIDTQKEILKTMSDFYANLYTSRTSSENKANQILANVEIERAITEIEKQNLDTQPTKLEIQQALNQVKENKSPGLDGIPIELYKEFWHILETQFINMINESIERKTLPFTTRTAVLSIIHKKGDKTDLRNYRPLSLNNVDYKIIAQVFASRLQKVADKLISHDQTAYIKGRSINTSVRKILDIYEYVESNDKNGAMICIDFEKAFDSVEHDFIFKTLEKFNFGERFIGWIKMFYKNPGFKVKNNGWISHPQTMTRGIRQGCSMSALLFVLVVEVMAQMIRKNKNIEGIEIGKTEFKIAQYADDSTIFVRNTKSIKELIYVLKRFEKEAGLKLNLKKTQGIWLGKLKDLGLRICESIVFTGNPVKCLGVYIGHKKEKSEEKNWAGKLNSIKSIIGYWNKLSLSFFAKIKVIKTYILSKITYLASVIPVPEHILKEIKKISFAFLWNGKRERIKRSTIFAKTINGGLGMIDYDSYITSLSAAWVGKYFLHPGTWTAIFKHYCNKIGMEPEYLFSTNFTDIKQLQIVKKLPKFYIDVLLSFNKCKTNIKLKTSDTHHSLVQPLWGNTNFQENEKCLFFHEWINEGILYVKDLINDNGAFKSDEDLFNTITNKRNIINQIYIIKNYVHSKLKHNDLSNATYTRINTKPTILFQNRFHDVTKARSKLFYQCLVSRKLSKGNMESVWAKKFNFSNSSKMWNLVYKQKILDVKIVKISEFNYKLLHNIVPCGKILSKWQHHISERCKTCKEIETSEHMLFECEKVKKIWNIISKCVKVNIKWKNIVCGFLGSEQGKNVDFLNLIISVVTYSLFKFNNQEKWKMDNLKCTIEQYVMRNILFYKLYCTQKNMKIFTDKRIDMITDKLL